MHPNRQTLQPFTRDELVAAILRVYDRNEPRHDLRFYGSPPDEPMRDVDRYAAAILAALRQTPQQGDET
jgi:hypothetical protein